MVDPPTERFVADWLAAVQSASPGEARLDWPGRDDCFVPSDDGPPQILRRDLGVRLRAELDRALAAEVLRRAEGDVDLGVFVRAARRQAAGPIAELAAAEEARLAAWLAPPVATESWCLTLDRVPERWQTAVIAAGAVDDSGDRPVVDTAGLSPDLAAAVVTDGGLADICDGWLIHGDNARGLRWLAEWFAGRVQCVYIDPPFNSGNYDFAYVDRLPSALWLTMMHERLQAAVPLLRDDGSFFAHIDQHEKERLRLLLDEHLTWQAEIIWRIGWVSGFKTRAPRFIRNHDTIYQYSRGERPAFYKQYLPYPPGYVRRGGQVPTGPGFPIEDTWNCSPQDPLHSIQIMSYSREKVGNDALTQKNENLLARIIQASTREGDWVLDYFAGTATCCAAAHKLGRRWLGLERGEVFDRYALPRLKRVLAGDRYGISKNCGWSGGGVMRVVRLAPV